MITEKQGKRLKVLINRHVAAQIARNCIRIQHHEDRGAILTEAAEAKTALILYIYELENHNESLPADQH